MVEILLESCSVWEVELKKAGKKEFPKNDSFFKRKLFSSHKKTVDISRFFLYFLRDESNKQLFLPFTLVRNVTPFSFLKK